jgi:hypothetical protein
MIVRKIQAALVLLLLMAGLQACYATALPLTRWDTIAGEGYVRFEFARANGGAQANDPGCGAAA